MNKPGLTHVQARAPRGMADVLPDAMPLVRALEETARDAFHLYGYAEIRTPLFEQTSLFVRGIGEATDIVEKEMYTFQDTADEGLTLRPEATASVVRAFLEHDMAKQRAFRRLYYVGPMFRREKPQAGRMREFYQLGVEAIGSYEAAVDAEVMLLAMQVFAGVGLEGCVLKLNSIGCERCRGDYRAMLRERLMPALPRMCRDCRSRYERNVFRILDCKRPECKEVTRALPPMRDYLDEPCATHFAAVRRGLDAAAQAYVIDDHLVRGFDYYTRTVFEITHPCLGARDAICGGGRYDNLVADLGGPPTGAAGFAIGELPAVLALKAAAKDRALAGPRPTVYVVAVGDDARDTCFQIASDLRRAGIAADFDAQGRSLKAQMRSAHNLGARYAALIGSDEVASRQVTLKDMAAGEQEKVPMDTLATRLKERSP